MVTLSNLGLEPPLRDLEFAHLSELGFRMTKKPSEQESWQDGRTNPVSQIAPIQRDSMRAYVSEISLQGDSKGTFCRKPTDSIA